jgi:hypothetical protein
MAAKGIDPATFQFVAQCLNHCATACPTGFVIFLLNKRAQIKDSYALAFTNNSNELPFTSINSTSGKQSELSINML